MDYHWLLTSTFYSNWLHGDPRGFVGRVRDRRSGDSATAARITHTARGTPYDADLRGLHHHARAQLKGESVRVSAEQAAVLLAQFRETAAVRRWALLAAAVMANHVHLVVRVTGYCDAAKLLGDFKAYGSRALNRRWGKPAGGTWWTYHGSTRVPSHDRSVAAAVRYVVRQRGALAVYVDSSGVA